MNIYQNHHFGEFVPNEPGAFPRYNKVYFPDLFRRVQIAIDPMNGSIPMHKNINPAKLMEAGRATRFGPHWPGLRCGATTRGGHPCQKAALTGRARCRLHGGLSTGPRTLAGKAAISAARLKHGERTVQRRAEDKERAAVNRKIWRALRERILLLRSQGYIR